MTSVSPLLTRRAKAKERLRRANWTSWLADQRLQGFVGIATLTSIAGGLYFGWVQADSAIKEYSERTTLQQDALANDIYLSYINTAIEYPAIAEHIDEVSVRKLTSDDRVRYAWNVEKVLYSAEFIMSLSEIPLDWEQSFRIEIKRHYFYFNSCEFKEGELGSYMPQVQALVKRYTETECRDAGVPEWRGAYYNA